MPGTAARSCFHKWEVAVLGDPSTATPEIALATLTVSQQTYTLPNPYQQQCAKH
jgi:hypothetical protein